MPTSDPCIAPFKSGLSDSRAWTDPVLRDVASVTCIGPKQCRKEGLVSRRRPWI